MTESKEVKLKKIKKGGVEVFPNIKPKVMKVPKSLIVKQAEVKLVSFEVTAVIPTQEYGNIMPKFVVETNGLGAQAAIDHVMPFIETLYQTYGETPRSGKPLKFLSKAHVTATEKIVDPSAIAPNAIVPNAPAKNNVVPDSETVVPLGSTVPVPVKPAKEAPEAPVSEGEAKSAAYTKAENAVLSASSLDALNLIEDKVIQSEKLSHEEKMPLYEMILKKHKELKEKTA